jgi:hypothetical protein
MTPGQTVALMRNLRQEYRERERRADHIRELFSLKRSDGRSRWMIVWEKDDDGDAGGYIATNGHVFTSLRALKSLSPEVYKQCMAEACLEEGDVT